MSPYTCVDCGTEYRTELGLAGHICTRKYPGLAPIRTMSREPTPAMCVAGLLVSEAEHDPAGVWRAMWDAAPHAEQQEPSGCNSHGKNPDSTCPYCAELLNQEAS